MHQLLFLFWLSILDCIIFALCPYKQDAFGFGQFLLTQFILLSAGSFRVGQQKGRNDPYVLKIETLAAIVFSLHFIVMSLYTIGYFVR